MIKIAEIDDDFGAWLGGIKAGDCLVSINGHEINDLLDYRFYSADEDLALIFQKISGSRINVQYDAFENGPLEIEFKSDPIKRCKNKCLFCFVHQLPRGLRKSLYVKDEDYRLSFTHGNYITLTNLSEDDFNRIIEMHLSPLYVSVHTTDEKLRRYMLGKNDIPPILPQLKRLTYTGIEIHTQIVVCPGLNDKSHVENTVNDLAALYPHLRSVAIVPVGLTGHRQRLPKLNEVTPGVAGEILDQCQKLQKKYLADLGTHFLFPADELFLKAGREIPPKKYYEDFPQVENGVGMVRILMSSRKLPALKLKKGIKVLIPTGTSIAETLQKVLDQKLTEVGNFEFKIIPIENHLMGKSVTVSGLLGGEDIFRGLKKYANQGDMIILPPNCLNSDDLFLDDWSPVDLEKKLKMPVVAGCYSVYNTFMPIFRRYR
jgi:putative radical SAM enzyme (TIGR03279 family)